MHADIGLLRHFGLVHEEERHTPDGSTYYILTATEDAALDEIQPYQSLVDRLSQSTAVVLELAATYDAFREMGSNHEEALTRLHQKKGTKCQGGNLDAALGLQAKLGLPTS